MRCLRYPLLGTCLIAGLLAHPVEARERLVILVEANAQLRQFHEEMAQQFAQSHDVDIQVVTATGNYPEQVRVMLASGAQLDITQLWAEVAAPFFQTGAFLDLQPFLAGERDVRLRDFAPPRVQAFTWQGRLYALPANANVFLGYYNQDAFQKAGLEPPEQLGAGWNWSTLVQYARRLSSDQNGDGTPDMYGLTTSTSLERFPVFIEQAGGHVFDRYSDPTRATLSDPRSLVGLEFLAGLFTQERVAQIGRSFQRGEVAMVFPEGPFMAANLASAQLSFSWGAMDLPRGPVHNGTILLGIGYQITANARSPRLAWEFIKYLAANRASVSRMVQLTGRTPAYLPVLPAYREYLQRQHTTVRVFADKLLDTNNFPGAIIPKLNDVRPVIEGLVRQALDGQISPRQAAAEIDRRVTAILGEGR